VSTRSRMRCRGAALAACSALLAGALAPAGASASSTDLHLAEGGGATFPARALVLTLPPHTSVTPSQVHVSENGKPVSGVVLSSSSSAAADDFGVVLAIDVSPTMRGAPLERAIAAARALAAQRTGAQQLGIITFDRRARVALPLTSDPSAITRALSHVPHVGSGALIYNALNLSVEQLANAKIAAGAVILLSDGASQAAAPNPHHRATASEVGQAASAAHAQIYTVGLRDSSFSPERMSLLARVGGGAFIESNSSQLASVFTQIESQLRSADVIHYRSLEPHGTHVFVTVHVDGFEQDATLSYDTPPRLRPASIGPVKHHSFWISGLALALACLLAALLVGAAVLAYLAPRARAHGLRRRIGAFTMTMSTAEVVAPANDDVPWHLRTLERALERTGWWERFKVNVDVAHMHRSPLELAGWCVAGTIVVAAVIGLAMGTPVASILVLPLGPLALNAIVNRLVQRQRELFAEQLPAQLQELASSMRAGHALVPSVGTMARGAPEPSRSEWSRVVADEQLGVPLQEALVPLGERMQSSDIDQVALVAALHTRTGGNMAEVLERVADSVRERGELRRELRALTAQARLSRIVVTALPFIVGALITIVNPDYEKPLFNSTVGIVLVVIAGLLVTAGSLWMRSLTQIEA
jgi:tight adherence protein B